MDQDIQLKVTAILIARVGGETPDTQRLVAACGKALYELLAKTPGIINLQAIQVEEVVPKMISEATQ